MNDLIGYPVVYWSLRILLIVLALVSAWLFLVNTARYFRPSHVREMLRADLPKVEEFGAEFRGFKAKIRFNAQATALNVLENRIEALESGLRRLWAITEEHSRALTELSLKTENGNGE